MRSKVFTFWEGNMPEYLKLCMKTWNFPYIVLTYESVKDYTDLDVEKIKRFTLSQQADIVRAHVLRDQGGYWLDTDTIIIGELPAWNIMGDPIQRTNTTGYLYAYEKDMEFFKDWAAYQDEVVADLNCKTHWSVTSNDFTDPYVRDHKEITIGDVRKCWPEIYMIQNDKYRRGKYEELYFHRKFTLSDFETTDMLMLHNSWTPDWYKGTDPLSMDCTLTNILKEIL